MTSIVKGNVSGHKDIPPYCKSGKGTVPIVMKIWRNTNHVLTLQTYD
jgi:hypothetical protein